jgi:HTH-type transcriptional regulator, sugar sensing transcriptional regulator
MLKELQDIGLSEKEARVYLASLELGRTTAEKLAKHAKVNRSTTYVQLESLMRKGLASTYEEDKKTYFTPESPELLRRLLSKQRDEITTREKDLTLILPTLLEQFEGAGERPIVRFFPGKEGIRTVREEILKMKEKKLHVVFSSDNMTKIFPGAELDEYTVRRKAAGIYSKGLYTQRDFFNRADLDELTDRRFLPDLFLTVDMRIFDDKAALFSVEGSVFGMIIESKQIASSMKALFDFLWKGAEKPSEHAK